ncbi:MAG: HNH/ENDO VII family nuclease [Bacteroidota bacterium]
MNYVRAGFEQISTAAEGVGIHETISLPEIIADQEGYILAYLSNENAEEVAIHWDDFTVYHGKTNVVNADSYYPFGMRYSSYQRIASSTNFMNTFQDQEYDEETGWVQFKWRNHMPDIGRFFNIDPLTESFYHNSPYAFSENRVINGIELEGLEYISTFDKFQYDGGALDYLKAIPNAATDVANYSISLYNTTAAYAIGDVNIIENEVAGLQAIRDAASGAVDYLNNTSGSEILSDAGDFVGSPGFFGEVTLGTLLGGLNKIDNLSIVSKVNGASDDLLQGGNRLSNDRLNAAPDKRGNAPIGDDGNIIELHHRNQTSNGPIDEMTRTDHRGGSNFSKNHSNTGQQTSNIDRKKFNQLRKQHWQKEWDNGRFNNLPDN